MKVKFSFLIPTLPTLPIINGRGKKKKKPKQEDLILYY